MSERRQNITALLRDWQQGDEGAFERLIPLVYRELHQIARRHIRHERPDHSLQATALVNEAYLRLVDTKRVAWQDRVHFLAVAARVMRHILVDHARAVRAHKRGGAAATVTFDLPDGRVLVYLPRIPSLDFCLLEFATGATRQLTRLENQGALRTFDITPDGKHIVFDRSKQNANIVLIELPSDPR